MEEINPPSWKKILMSSRKNTICWLNNRNASMKVFKSWINKSGHNSFRIRPSGSIIISHLMTVWIFARPWTKPITTSLWLYFQPPKVQVSKRCHKRTDASSRWIPTIKDQLKSTLVNQKQASSNYNLPDNEILVIHHYGPQI